MLSAQPFIDACFTSPAVGTSFAGTTNVSNRDSDLLRWTGSAWTGGWPGANITLPPPGSIVNTRAIWSGDGTVWTTGGEGFGLRLTAAIVSNTTYTFAFRRVSHGTGQNGNFAPVLYTNTGGSFGTSYGAITGVGTSWTTTNISFTASAASSGHTFVYFHNNVGSGMFLGCTTTILPMAFSDLQAFPVGQDVHLQWKIQDESNYVAHAIERSANGFDFEEIGREASVHAGPEGHLYTHADLTPISPEKSLFYRIRSYDQEGLEALSPVVEVAMGTASTFKVQVNPTLTLSGQNAVATFFAEENQSATFQICDLQGRSLQAGTAQVVAGRNEMQMPTADLAAGIYTLSLRCGSKVGTARFIVD